MATPSPSCPRASVASPPPPPSSTQPMQLTTRRYGVCSITPRCSTPSTVHNSSETSWSISAAASRTGHPHRSLTRRWQNSVSKWATTRSSSDSQAVSIPPWQPSCSTVPSARTSPASSSITDFSARTSSPTCFATTSASVSMWWESMPPKSSIANWLVSANPSASERSSVQASSTCSKPKLRK